MSLPVGCGAQGPDHTVADLDLDPWQWQFGWAGDDLTGAFVEEPLVAGALEFASSGTW